jgi:hypothetical protein
MKTVTQHGGVNNLQCLLNIGCLNRYAAGLDA